MKRIGLILPFVMVTMAGCSKRVLVPVESVSREVIVSDSAKTVGRLVSLIESLHIRDERKDSVSDHTKETVILNERGDTAKHVIATRVFVSSFREKEMQREIARRDSLIRDLQSRMLMSKVDSIPVPYPVEKIVEVKKHHSWLEQLMISLGFIALLAICAKGLYLVMKKKFG